MSGQIRKGLLNQPIYGSVVTKPLYYVRLIRTMYLFGLVKLKCNLANAKINQNYSRR